jgi:predicted acyltransferase
VFPINKSLWTSSYTVFTAGLALIFLAVCYWLVDVKGYRRIALPFVFFGTNAIAAFFLSSLGARVLTLLKLAGPDGEPIALKTYLYESWFASWLAPVNASLAFAVAYVLFWLAVMAWMYQRKIFIKV